MSPFRRRRQRTDQVRRPKLSVKQVLDWAGAYHERMGKWPIAKDGPIGKSRGETWSSVD